MVDAGVAGFFAATGGADRLLDFVATAVLAALSTAGRAGVALATTFAAGFAGDTVFFATGLAGVFALTDAWVAGLATGFFACAGLAGALLTAACFTGAFFATPFPWTTFPWAGLAMVFDAGLTATFFAAGAFTADFAVFTTDGLRAAAGFATAFTGAVGRFAAADLVTADLPAGVGLRPLPTLAFGLLTTVVGALLFFPLAAVELRVVFAIFLHRFWPGRPGVIAHVSYTSKHDSGILVASDVPARASYVNVLTRLILSLLRLYKRWLSPMLGPRCRFHPSCSDYARIAVTRFGPWRGSLLTGWRLLRCQPMCDGGEDPVPESFHFSRCHCHTDPTDTP